MTQKNKNWVFKNSKNFGDYGIYFRILISEIFKLIPWFLKSSFLENFYLKSHHTHNSIKYIFLLAKHIIKLF